MTFNELLALDDAKKEKVSRNRDTTVSRRRDTMIPKDHDTGIPSAAVEGIGKAVAVVGKEATTHRLRREEKEAVREVVYEYGQRGCKTSENEIVRIGINWLLADHASRKKGSLLHKVLEAMRGIGG